MIKGRMLKILAAATIVLAMMGAKDPACEEKKPDHTTRKNTHVESSKKRHVSIHTHGNGPYTLTRIATGPDGDGRSQTNSVVEHIAGGTHKAGYDYTTGTHLNIKVQVEGHAKDDFDCEIVDAGVPNKKDGSPGNRSYDRGKAQAYCEIWTHG